MESTGELAKRIEELRKSRGLSQVALAKLLELDPQTVRDYEKGRRSPKIKGLPRLAKALNVTVLDLIEGEGEPLPIRELPVSSAIRKMMAIPDDIYEKAQVFGAGHDVWGEVRAAFEDALIDMKESNKSKTSRS